MNDSIWGTFCDTADIIRETRPEIYPEFVSLASRPPAETANWLNRKFPLKCGNWHERNPGDMPRLLRAQMDGEL